MKNLFDYATKELSQDAFLRWFLENYDDKEIGPIVVDFINYFSKGQARSRQGFCLDYEDITELKAFSQVNDIDISVDFKSRKFEGHRTIVIEDKTYSNEHNQLKTYNEAIEKWHYEEGLTPEQCVYKVFYKTHKIEEEEQKRVEIAGWVPFGIEKIHEFFSKYLGKTHSDVLNDYINHINDIYDCYDKVSDKPLKEWNSTNWETYFNDFMKSHKGVQYTFTSYRGIYDAMLIYFYFKKNTYLTYIAFEIQIRNELKPYLHPGFHVGNDWYWSINSFKGDVLEQSEKELGELRSFVQNRNSFIERGNTARAFGKINETISLDENKESLTLKLNKWFNEVEKLIEEYKNN